MKTDARICHLSSLHKRYDTRIFLREAIGLQRNNWDVTLLVNDGLISEVKNDIKIQSVPRITNSVLRKLLVPVLFFFKTVGKFDIIHFHDPELIPLGLVLKLFGKKVIYDVHENYKSYTGVRFYSKYLSFMNRLAARQLTLVFAETSYKSNYPIVLNSIDVLNYPDHTFFNDYVIDDVAKNENNLVYIGGVNKERGLRETIDALAELKSEKDSLDFHFFIIGPERENELAYIKAGGYKQIASNISFLGYMPIEEAIDYATKSKIGIALTLPTPNYIASYSTKVFEYMAIGLPQIYSNFEVYNNVTPFDTGWSIDPLDKEGLKSILLESLTSNDVIKEKAKNCLLSKHEFSWENEIKKLSDLYLSL